ncbi:radical SAM protein [Candidatus Pacearchaeota archaeon]|nr:radical SAM protein [Candidatus Pacearchaeota archaeon]
MIENINLKQFNPQKIFQHLDRLAEWQAGKLVHPVCVEFFPSNLCNHSCIFCVSEYYKSKKEILSKKLMLRIIKEISRVSKAITFSGGGEPLANPNTIEAVESAKKNGLDVGFITNGELLDREKIRVLVKNCTWIRVSLDASSSKIYKKMHGKNADFNKTIKSLYDLVKEKKRQKSKVTIGAQFIIHPLNYKDVINCGRLVKRIGVDYYQIRPVDIRPEQKEHCKTYPQTIFSKSLKLIKDAIKLSDKNFDVLPSIHKFNDVLSPQKSYSRYYTKCLGPNFTTVIGADAKVYFCCYYAGYPQYSIGDLTKNSFKEIMNSKKRKKMFEKVDFSKCQPLCRNHEINKILYELSLPREHKNFL